MGLAEYIGALRSRWVVVGAAVLVGLLAAWITLPSSLGGTEVSYTAKAVLAPADTAKTVPAPADSTAAAPNLFLTRVLVTSPSVTDRAAQILGTKIDEVVAAEVDNEAKILTITATAATAQRAERLSNALAAATNDRLRATEADHRTLLADGIEAALRPSVARIAQLEASLAKNSTDSVLKAQVDSERAQYQLQFQQMIALRSAPGADPFTVLEPARSVKVVATQGAYQTTPALRLAGLGGLGLLLGLALAFGLERLDGRVRTRHAAEVAFRAPAIASVPDLSTAEAASSAATGEGGVAESVRGLRSALVTGTIRLGAPEGPKVLLLASAHDGEGRSVLVAALASRLAELDRSVLVVDANLRAPAQPELLGTSPEAPGLAEILEQRQAWEVAHDLEAHVVATAVPGVRLLPAGRAGTRVGRTVSRIESLMPRIRAMADLVVIDAPGFLDASDAATIAAEVDAVLLLAQQDRTSTRDAGLVREQLDRLGARVIASTLVARRRPQLSVGRRRSVSPTSPRAPVAGQAEAEEMTADVEPDRRGSASSPTDRHHQ